MQRYADTSARRLACGRIPPNPSELLQSQAMETLLLELRETYDIVILDAPPLLPVTDAALLATRADGAVVVVSHGRTTRDQLSTAIDRLESVDATTLGVVVNLTPARRRPTVMATATAMHPSRSPNRSSPASAAAAEPGLTPGRAAPGTGRASSAYAARSVRARPRAPRAGRWSRPGRRG